MHPPNDADERAVFPVDKEDQQREVQRDENKPDRQKTNADNRYNNLS